MPSAEPLFVTLFVPGLVPWPQQRWPQVLSGLPSLHRLLSRAKTTQRGVEHLPALLLSAFGVERQSDWPVAPYTLLADGGDPSEAFWMRADPVHLLPQQGQLVLVDTGPLLLSAQACESLVESVNSHLAADGPTLCAPGPQRWYMRLPRELRIQTTPPDLAAGRNVDALLPEGGDALLVHRWSNEVQMLLHEHPVNAAREARGELPVNSLWLWGAGRLARVPIASARHVWADETLMRGLALASEAPLHLQPDSAEAWLASANAGEHWILLDSFAISGGHAQARAWEARAQQLEEAWFAPLLAALSARRVGEVTLATVHEGRALSFRVASGDLWKLWRRSVSLARD